MKRIILVISMSLFVWLQAISSFAQVIHSRFLKADGEVLRNQYGKGDIVNLRGTNLGSWLSMEAWIGPLGKAALKRVNWQISSSYKNVSGLSSLIDGISSTKWQAPVNQQSAGSWIQIDLGKSDVFDEIVLQMPTEARPQLSLKVSADGTQWDTVGKAKYSGNRVIYPVDAKAWKQIRIYLPAGTDELPVFSEIYAYMDDDFSVRNALIERFGGKGTDELFDTYQQLWITKADLDSIKKIGLNMVRVPVYWMELMDNDGLMKTGAFKQLDWLVKECKQRNLYVIIDLHGAPGGVDAYITSGQAFRNEIWNEEKWRVYTENIWKAIASHFKGDATVAAYDLLNEPVSSNKTYQTKKLYDRLYKVVRQIDPDHVIAMGAFYTFDFLGSPAQNNWSNVLYQVHYYNTDIGNKDSQEGTLKYALNDLITHQHEWNVPVYAGEYSFWQYTDIWQKWMEGMNSKNISWSNWCYKNRVTSPANWSFYQGNDNPVPDMSFDSLVEIKAKWQKFTTPYFKTNKDLIDVVSRNSQTPPNTQIIH